MVQPIPVMAYSHCTGDRDRYREQDWHNRRQCVWFLSLSEISVSISVECIKTHYGSFTLHGAGTGTGNGTRKNGFLYIMQNCSYCMGLGQGQEPGTGTGNLAMGSIPIFPVPVPVPVLPFLVSVPVPCSVNAPLIPVPFPVPVLVPCSVK